MNSKQCWVIVEEWTTDFSYETRWDIVGVYDNKTAAELERDSLLLMNNGTNYSKYYIKRCAYYETRQPD